MTDEVSMINLNTKGKEKNSYDAIVIGSGMSGGWAVKELCDNGLSTLLLERGRNVEHIKDYPTALLKPWELRHGGEITLSQKQENPIVSKHQAYKEDTAHFFVKDDEHPYIQEKPFGWIRGYQLGGRSLMWGRQVQRWSEYEFGGPDRMGSMAQWPIEYKDLSPWYSHVETFIGVSGNRDGLDVCPDGEFLEPWQMNCVEKHIVGKIHSLYKNRPAIIGRCAHITVPRAIHLAQGRGKCQARNVCSRGCPYGGYFSSNSSTIPWAQKTGNLTLRVNSVVHSIIFDEKQNRAIGVRVVDQITKTITEFFSKIIFLNASTLNTNLILLNSISRRFPQGLGNDNGLLGRYISNHNMRGAMGAFIDGFENSYYYGRRPTNILIPFFKNVKKQDTDFQGSYQVCFESARVRAAESGAIGAELKETLSKPGPWGVRMYLIGERSPNIQSRVYLSSDKKDSWDVPLLVTSVEWDSNDEAILKDFFTEGSEMLQKAGCSNISTIRYNDAPGYENHEMGGVRMGNDPKSSLLNRWNQLHSCKNVFVTDGACMVSTGTKNPSLTYMALTARACNYAVSKLKQRSL